MTRTTWLPTAKETEESCTLYAIAQNSDSFIYSDIISHRINYERV